VISSTKLSARVLIAFACVYFFWGSTYVAIRFGVEVLPPFVLAAVRYIIAGVLMLGLCAAKGLKLRQTPRDFVWLAVIGIAMLSLGNGSLVWCEQFLSSGLSALLLAVIPIYVALIEVFLPKGEGLRAKGWLGIAIGFGGLIILVWPGLLESLHGSRTQLIGTGVALAGALAWTSGSILSRRTKLAATAFVAAAWEMLFAGLFNTVVMFATHSYHDVHWNTTAVLSIAWLVTFGSIVGYTAFIYLLDNVPVAKVSTYAYINPIVAVILGAIFLHERLVPIEYAGMAAILIAVYLVTSSKLRSGKQVAEIECTVTEQEA
jgi:drug/metabolite transporter (DMT)-like permease